VDSAPVDDNDVNAYRRTVKSVEQLLHELQHGTWAERRDAAQELGRCSDQRAFEPLIAALSDPESQVIGAAILALGQLRDSRAVPDILTLFPNSMYTSFVARALGWIGDMRAVQPMINALQAEVPVMRLCAAQALVELVDQRSVEPLIATLHDPVYPVRQWAAEALKRLNDPRAVEPLLEILNDPHPEVRASVALALGELGDRRAVEPLIAAVRTEEDSVRCSAACALGKLGDLRAFDVLLAGVTGEYGDRGVRYFAVAALGKLRDQRALEPLLLALKDENEVVRIAAADALGDLGDVHALSALEWARDHDAGCDEFGYTVCDTAEEAIVRIQQNPLA
jgi:HEAT repeat protein